MLLKNLLLSIISLFIIFLLCELNTRHNKFAWPFEIKEYVPPYLSKEEVHLRWRFTHAPGQGRNSLGLKNREILPKRKGVFRLLFLGDSLIHFGETSSDSLYTEVIEARLNRASTDSTKYEAINAGIPGYTTYQEFEFLKLHGLSMKPDMVILGFVFNDVFYKYLHKLKKNSLLSKEPDSQLHYFDTSGFPGVLFKNSHFAHELFRMLKVAKKQILSEHAFPFERREDFYLAWKDHGWSQVEKTIPAMKSVLLQKNIPLAVVIFPVVDQVNVNYRRMNQDYVLYPQKRIKRICEVNNIPYLDLTDAIFRNGDTALYRDYLHLNVRGNDVVANEITDYLVSDLRTLN